ncbi:hypothetical protein Tco_0924557 [Tanacetum coccineum]|uniref:Uncharacterized protein n=1 Tax=Tanacetum coccineum TaxID=301880 RepID=A0ABQ5D777_9ASTR
MSSMGELTFFLGLQVKQKDDGIFISQDKYVADILKKFDFATVKTASTPIETNKALLKDEEAEDVDVHLYRSMIGSLMYLTASRPDIMFAVCACARFQVTPKVSHLHVVKSASLDMEIYKEFVNFLANEWCLWIQNQMLDYGFNFMNTKIHIDNESTICIVKNPVFHSKTKHIEIRHHFIRDSYEKRLIQVIKIHTDHNVADLLTKAFDVSSDEFGVKTGSCKVNAAKQDLVLLGEKGNADFHQIVDFLNASTIRYSLTISPTIYASYIEQFWATAKSKIVNNETQIHAKVDGKTIVISESSVRSNLHFNDEDGVTSLTNSEILENLALMGYEIVFDKLTFQKAFFSPQWKYLIHTILHCLSSKSTAWNEFSTNIASAVICLENNQKFNFSKLIFDEPFNDTYETPKHTQKVFANMRRKGKSFSRTITPLFASMLVLQVVKGKGSRQPSEPQPPPSTAPPSQEGQSGGPPEKVGDEVVHKELGDRVERDATTAASLDVEQDSGNILKTQSTQSTAIPNTRSERVPTPSYDSPLLGGNTPKSDEERLEQHELTDNVPPTPYDSPLLGGYTPGSNEGKLKQDKLTDIVTALSQKVEGLESDLKKTKKLYATAFKKLINRGIELCWVGGVVLWGLVMVVGRVGRLCERVLIGGCVGGVEGCDDDCGCDGGGSGCVGVVCGCGGMKDGMRWSVGVGEGGCVGVSRRAGCGWCVEVVGWWGWSGGGVCGVGGLYWVVMVVVSDGSHGGGWGVVSGVGEWWGVRFRLEAVGVGGAGAVGGWCRGGCGGVSCVGECGGWECVGGVVVRNLLLLVVGCEVWRSEEGLCCGMVEGGRISDVVLSCEVVRRLTERLTGRSGKKEEKDKEDGENSRRERDRVDVCCLSGFFGGSRGDELSVEVVECSLVAGVEEDGIERF